MPEFGTFRDMRDGYEYKTVRIGKQIWLAENFRYDCAGSAVYDNDEDYLDRYGRLYTWRTAMNAAPDGWRLPGKKDWNVLTKHVGGEEAGRILKSRERWNDFGNGTDDFGFNALPGGRGSGGGFNYAGDCGVWWSASENRHVGSIASARFMYHDEERAFWDSYSKSFLFSVRLLRS